MTATWNATDRSLSPVERTVLRSARDNLKSATRWCRGALARDGWGNVCDPDDARAVEWDVLGALLHAARFCHEPGVAARNVAAAMVRAGTGGKRLEDFNDSVSHGQVLALFAATLDATAPDDADEDVLAITYQGRTIHARQERLEAWVPMRVRRDYATDLDVPAEFDRPAPDRDHYPRIRADVAERSLAEHRAALRGLLGLLGGEPDKDWTDDERATFDAAVELLGQEFVSSVKQPDRGDALKNLGENLERLTQALNRAGAEFRAATARLAGREDARGD